MVWSGIQDLGDYGELSLAPALLRQIGLKQIIDLNREIHPNFPWADFCGEKEGRWWMINVKTRVKYEKSGRINSSYNSSPQTKQNYYNAISRLEQKGFVDCKPIWLAIAMRVDQTFDAYWGKAEEMNHFGESNIYWGIRMGKKAIVNYQKNNRMIAEREPHGFDWIKYPDNWTFEAHKKWLRQIK